MAEATDTRTRLLDAAAELFAERGVGAVSSREITRAAGIGNASGLQYHFGDQRGLLRAILARHHPAVEARRHALLDEIEARPADLRDLAGALVRPPAAELATESGRRWLRIVAELTNRADYAPGPGTDRSDSTTRWRTLIEPLIDDEARALHRRFVAIRFSAVELGRRAATGAHRDDRLFTSHLVDLTTALLSGPLSEETKRLTRSR